MGKGEYSVVATPVGTDKNGILFDLDFPAHTFLNTRVTLPYGSNVEKAIPQIAQAVIRIHFQPDEPASEDANYPSFY